MRQGTAGDWQVMTTGHPSGVLGTVRSGWNLREQGGVGGISWPGDGLCCTWICGAEWFSNTPEVLWVCWVTGMKLGPKLCSTVGGEAGSAWMLLPGKGNTRVTFCEEDWGEPTVWLTRAWPHASWAASRVWYPCCLPPEKPLTCADVAALYNN